MRQTGYSRALMGRRIRHADMKIRCSGRILEAEMSPGVATRHAESVRHVTGHVT